MASEVTLYIFVLFWQWFFLLEKNISERSKLPITYR